MRFVQIEDLRLVHSAKMGSTEAFTVLVRNYKNFVYRTAQGIMQNHADAEDITQETFVKAYFALRKLKDERAFPSWLATIAVRLALDAIKKRGSAMGEPLDGNTLYDGTNEAQQLDLRLSMMQALGKLNIDHRTIVVLREIQGFDYQEIAEILDIPLGTVRSRLHAARMQLRKELSDQER